MRRLILTIITVLVASSMYGQEIEFRKNIVLVNGKECLKIEEMDQSSVSIYDLEGNELVFMRYINNSQLGNVYNKIVFIEQKVALTCQSHVFTKASLIKKLLSEKVLENCNLNSEKVEIFVLKFDENIERK